MTTGMYWDEETGKLVSEYDIIRDMQSTYGYKSAWLATEFAGVPTKYHGAYFKRSSFFDEERNEG